MVHTLENLMEFHGADAKAIIWEHNTHIGDARATDMCDDGTVNVGQIINEEHKPEVFSEALVPTRGRLLLDVSGGMLCRLWVPEGKSTVGNMNCTNSRLKIGSYL
jgi:erythromycin esterase-like protein